MTPSAQTSIPRPTGGRARGSEAEGGGRGREISVEEGTLFGVVGGV